MSLSFIPRDGSEFAGSKAAQACTACRKQKRKCDKSLPACGLCVRMSRPCDYTDVPQPAPTADDLAALQLKLLELENRLNQTGSSSASVEETPMFSPPREPLWHGGVNQFPNVVFLDLDAFRWLDMTIPKPSVEIPAVSTFRSMS
jgi:Fungal Zn(2)-Cys(6) binuclear cluster domain